MTKNLLSSYHFEVPEELIAQDPETKRDESKLLERKASQEIIHQKFYNLVDALPEDSLLILNETKVFSCRLLTKTKTGGKLEVFLLEDPISKKSSILKALIKPFKKIKTSEVLTFSDNVEACILEIKKEQNTQVAFLQFNLPPEKLFDWISKTGSIPLPPYIKRSDRRRQEQDLLRYQTVYAENVGSVAAPTAGLHFTQEILKKLKEKNITLAHITLHVGLGTFLPIKVDDIRDHYMHEETYLVPKKTLELIKEKERSDKKIIFVGTTTLWALESFFLKAKKQKIDLEELTDTWLQTNLFIHPTEEEVVYKPQKGHAIITNFHQPGSSLFILICALIGKDEALKLYKEAIDKKYRFFSYGDSSFLWF